MPKKNYTVELTKRAEKDFKSIQRYTLQKYGAQQVIKYSEQIKDGLNNLCENPALYGHGRPDIPEKCRAYRLGEHSIVYRVEKNTVFVLAILHGNMNFIEQLR